MGRNSSGNLSNAHNNSQNSSKGRTEGGYTGKMMKNIVGLEQKYRSNKNETLHVFNDKGDILKSIGGKGAKVMFSDKLPENSILTHNHPRSIGQSGIKAIGNSFSADDIVTTIKYNAKEMRAVTPTYTFSLKRPKGGWKVTAKEARIAFKNADKDTFNQFLSYLKKRNYSDSAIARAGTLHFHRVMEIISKQFGWDYTKKRG